MMISSGAASACRMRRLRGQAGSCMLFMRGSVMRAACGGRADRARPARRARPAVCGAGRRRRLVGAQLEDIGQHFGHRGVQLLRESRRRSRCGDTARAPAAALRAAARCARAPISRIFAATRVGALGDDARRAHLAFAYLQRHRVVRRVGDHHVGLRHFGHHAAARHLALLLADRGLDLRIAFGFLVSWRTSSLASSSASWRSATAGTARRCAAISTSAGDDRDRKHDQQCGQVCERRS